MNIDATEQYLNRISYEMPRKVSRWLNLPSELAFVPVTVRVLLAPTLTYKVVTVYYTDPRRYPRK